MRAKVKPYRENVGILVFNKEFQVLLGQSSFYPDAWQLPQGGIHKNESPHGAALRELKEETGLELPRATVAAFELSHWLYYDFPEHMPSHLQAYQGQKQKWFFFFWDVDSQTSLAKLDSERYTKEAEFQAFKWAPLDAIIDQVAPFKRKVYKKLIRIGHGLLEDYRKQRCKSRDMDIKMSTETREK